jgi:sulfotransferase family protein
VGSADRRPILVTGIPRSGTTWLARTLAQAPGTSMLGREPMNPRDRQFGLDGRLNGWVRCQDFDRREARLLRRVYNGRVPRTYGRLGVRQRTASLPWQRIVVKDSFALLSLPAVVAATRAVPILIYRHPAAVLASYRRLGWRADAEEFTALGAPPGEYNNDAHAMAMFWSWGHQVALADLNRLPDSVVVSHQELTMGGAAAQAELFRTLSLSAPVRRVRDATGPADFHLDDVPRHYFDRTPDQVTTGWRTLIEDADIDLLERETASLWDHLEERRIRLPQPSQSDGESQ